ncbi:hypothetical protein YM18_1969 [Geobacter sulfurreducens]|nr:hypothetical protein YM18_1969 [Geobacter sulfurreducens]
MMSGRTECGNEKGELTGSPFLYLTIRRSDGLKLFYV